MGLFDKAKDLASENSDAVNEGLDKATDFANEKTGGQYEDQIQQGADFARDQLGGQGDQGDADQQQGGFGDNAEGGQDG